MEDEKKCASLTYSSFPRRSQLQLTAQTLLAILGTLAPSRKIFGSPSPCFIL